MAPQTPAMDRILPASDQGGSKALILPGLVAAYLVVLGLALRDPRGRWTYVVTDRRLMTFYNGQKLRDADVSRLNRLTVIRGIDGRRGIRLDPGSLKPIAAGRGAQSVSFSSATSQARARSHLR